MRPRAYDNKLASLRVCYRRLARALDEETMRDGEREAGMRWREPHDQQLCVKLIAALEALCLVARTLSAGSHDDGALFELSVKLDQALRAPLNGEGASLAGCGLRRGAEAWEVDYLHLDFLVQCQRRELIATMRTFLDSCLAPLLFGQPLEVNAYMTSPAYQAVG